MSAAHEIISALVAGGMDPIEAASLVARAAVEMTATAPSAGAMRTRKWRLKASQTVTCDAEKSEPENVTNRHKPSQNVTSDNTPLSSSKIDLRKRGERLASDWSPSDADRAFGKDLGWSDSQIDNEAANFRDYWIAKPGSGGCKLDWPATWRKWVRSSKVKPAGTAATAMPSFSTPADIDWRNVVTFYKKSGIWSKWAGPDPDSAACRAPPELLREFGLLKSA